MVRESVPPAPVKIQLGNQPRITMRCLPSTGRFGNQLIAYAFLRAYAWRHQGIVESPPWIGRELFGIQDELSGDWYPLLLDRYTWEKMGEPEIPVANIAADSPRNPVDLAGYFQETTADLAVYQQQLRDLFTPLPEIRMKLDALWAATFHDDETVVGIHLRRGDFGVGRFFYTPVEWVVQWLNEIWPRLHKPRLFIATDTPGDLKAALAAFDPVLGQELTNAWPEVPYYQDFHFLTKLHRLAISNSSFSTAASMLNRQCSEFVRPCLEAKRLVTFDPWNTPVQLPQWAGDHPELPQVVAPWWQRHWRLFRKRTLRRLTHGLIRIGSCLLQHKPMAWMFLGGINRWALEHNPRVYFRVLRAIAHLTLKQTAKSLELLSPFTSQPDPEIQFWIGMATLDGGWLERSRQSFEICRVQNRYVASSNRMLTRLAEK